MAYSRPQAQWVGEPVLEFLSVLCSEVSLNKIVRILHTEILLLLKLLNIQLFFLPASFERRAAGTQQSK